MAATKISALLAGALLLLAAADVVAAGGAKCKYTLTWYEVPLGVGKDIFITPGSGTDYAKIPLGGTFSYETAMLAKDDVKSTRVGTDTGLCAVVPSGISCTLYTTVKGGSLSHGGLLPVKLGTSGTVPILGGTGKFVGATGYTTLTNVAPSGAQKFVACVVSTAK